jgi:hypothetical protein
MDCPQVRTSLFCTGHMLFKIFWILQLEYVFIKNLIFVEIRTVCSFETLVSAYKSTRRHLPCSQNLKYHITDILFRNFEPAALEFTPKILHVYIE